MHGANSLPSRRVTDEEKYAYARGGHLAMVLFGAVSGALLIAGLCRFALLEGLLWVAVPFVLLNGTYLVLSYSVMLVRGTFRLPAHQARVTFWTSASEELTHRSVDVFLPVCGEDPAILLETWSGVQQLAWPGPLQVYVLDDSADDSLRQTAMEHGFHYLRRTGRELRKAGNLRHGFAHSEGEFILLLDADFRPRPEMLLELVPSLLDDEQLAIVQSPQYFDVQRSMNWVEAGAGFVQELFYRLIQPARDQFGAAVCVGSCAVYRRTALKELDGAPSIDHSEDLWTGFELLHRGWKIRYVPVILAKGLCPSTLEAFFRQQNRWCRGSYALVLSRRFWTSRLTLPQKFCYFSGLMYYLATAMNCLLTPLPPVIMVCLFPDWVHWNHLAFSILALIYTPFIIGWWSRYGWGVHFLSTREVSGAAHLHTLIETVLGRPNEWIATGRLRRTSSWWSVPALLSLLLLSSICGAVAVWGGATIAIAARPERWFHFLPPLLFSTLHLAICWRVLEGVPLTALFPGQRTATSVPVRKLRLETLMAGLALLLILTSWAAARTAFHTDRQITLPVSVPLAAAVRTPFSFSIRSDASLGDYVVERAFPELNLQRVIRMREYPGRPGSWFVADYTGRIHLIQSDGDRWSKRLVADLSSPQRGRSDPSVDREQDEGEERRLAGSNLSFLYSIAVHPNFPEDPRLFLAYSTSREGEPFTWRVTSLQIPVEGCVDFRQEQLLIEQQIENTEHLGGDLAFDSTGCLLISCGDHERSLNDHRSQLLHRGFDSGILRIDIDQRGGDFSHPPLRTPDRTWTSNYFIPNDNPFLGLPDVLEEFWALGLRNPFRMNFDVPTGKLWIGDVGQDRMEQVEVAQAGSNHQWSFREGSLIFSQSYLHGQPPAEIHGTSTEPVHEYPHEDLNLCIIGGMIYRGSKFPELTGRHLYGDNRSGRIWSIDPDNPGERTLLLQLPFGKSSSTLVSITTDSVGEIYFTSFISTPSIVRLARSQPPGFPQKLSETGLFTGLAPLTPAEELIPYSVAVPLWSDGMEKQRWISLPEGTQVDNHQEKWQFPVGTVFIKHFSQGHDFQSPDSPVETRLLVVRQDGSTGGATYRWNEEGTEATLQIERNSLKMSTGSGPFQYHVPGFRDCSVCHHRDNPVLGFNEAQLNTHIVSGPGQTASQLTLLSDRQMLMKTCGDNRPETYRSLTRLDDESAPLESRVRSWLHAQCSFCHHQDGLEHIRLNLDMFSSEQETALIKVPAQLHYHKIEGRFSKFLIAPGNLEESAIYQRLKTGDPRYSMPYLGRTRPDERALQVVADWILSLAAVPQVSTPGNEQLSRTVNNSEMKSRSGTP